MDHKNKSFALNLASPYADAFRITKGGKFSKAKRNLSECYSRANSPSPNQYKPQDYETSKVSPRFSFGREKKFFLARKQLKCKTEIPGPGNYKPNQTRTTIKVTIPQGDRLGLDIKKDTPAVGSYQLQKQPSKHSSGIKFPKQKRQSLTNRSFGPAPNQYNLQQSNKKTSPRQTFSRSKKLSLKLESIPGVGQYTIFNFKQKRSPCAHIMSQRKNDRRYHTIDEPGPANYSSCSVEKYKPHSKLTQVIFSRAKRQEHSKELVPGPGEYNLSQKRLKNKGAFLTGRYIRQNCEQMPGPGNYQPKIDFIAEKSPSAKIGKALRLLNNKQTGPSPHDYQPQKAAKINFTSTGFSFPKNKRILQ